MMFETCAVCSLAGLKVQWDEDGGRIGYCWAITQAMAWFKLQPISFQGVGSFGFELKPLYIYVGLYAYFAQNLTCPGSSWAKLPYVGECPRTYWCYIPLLVDLTATRVRTRHSSVVIKRRTARFVRVWKRIFRGNHMLQLIATPTSYSGDTCFKSRPRRKLSLLILLDFFSCLSRKMATEIRLCSHNFTPFSIYNILIILLLDAVVFELLTQLLNLLAIHISFKYWFI
jgi:hypothetical protein